MPRTDERVCYNIITMCMVCGVVYSAASAAMVVSPFASIATLKDNVAGQQAVQANISRLQTLPTALADLTPPVIEKPEWYQKKVAEAARAAAKQKPNPTQKVVTYTISTKGYTSSDLGEFAAQVHDTLNDSRGWAQLGVSFKQVQQGGQFDLVLSQAELLPSFSSGCSAEWSCRVGKSVIVNDARWRGATTAWNQAGGNIRDYRHMVINHEVGHWLGHGHLNCSAPGAPAAVMQQQSIDLQGCAFNPWPLQSELWSTTLGVRQ